MSDQDRAKSDAASNSDGGAPWSGGNRESRAEALECRDDGHTYSRADANENDRQGHAMKATLLSDATPERSHPNDDKAVHNQDSVLSRADRAENQANLRDAARNEQKLGQAIGELTQAADKFTQSEPKSPGEFISAAGNIAHKAAAAANQIGNGFGERLEGTLGMQGNLPEAIGGILGEFSEGIAEFGGEFGEMGMNITGDVLSSFGGTLQHIEAGVDALRQGDLAGLSDLIEAGIDLSIVGDYQTGAEVLRDVGVGMIGAGGEALEGAGGVVREIGEAAVDTIDDVLKK